MIQQIFIRLLLLAPILPALLFAQTTSSGLSGTVQDPDGAMMPGVTVTLTGEANGFVRTVTTTSSGFFAFPNLTAPAKFTLTIDHAGFKSYRQTGIALESGEERSVGEIRLQLGQVSEKVEVTAEAAPVNLVTGERAGTLTGTQLDEIALRGRDIFDAVSLMAGVVDTSDGREAPSPTSIQNVIILGGRDDQKNVTVDGVTNLDTGANDAVSAMPSMDAVAEMKVLMSAYSAENGRNPFAINIITRGGGTSFHGQASYYFRNEALNANNFFSNSAGQPRQRYRYNIGSYSVGGPLTLPKLNQARKNLFFFFSQEYQNQVVPYPVKEVTVPTALERQGDFSQSYNNKGGAITVNDPLNGKQAFPGKVIPKSRLTSMGQAILNMFPMPNFVDSNLATRYNWNYYAAAAEPYNRRTETARIDWSPRDNWQLYFSGSNNADRQNVPYAAGNSSWVQGQTNYPLTPIEDQFPGRLGSLHSTNSISPSLFNEAVVSAVRNTITLVPTNLEAVDRTKLGINFPQRNPGLNPLNLIPSMTFSGISNFANPSLYNIIPYFTTDTIYSFSDNVSKIYRTHAFKMGIYYEHAQKLVNANTPSHGSLSFNTDANNPLDSNNAYANALLGNYGSYAEATAQPQGNFLSTNTEWYFQDDWKVKKYFTLNYGVRFYHDPAMYDKRAQLSSFLPGAWNPATAPVMIRPAVVNGQNVGVDPLTGKVYNNGLVGCFVPGVGNYADGEITFGRNGASRAPYETAPIAVAPRLGFAWDPFHDGKTSIRGGGGVYYDRIRGNPSQNLLSNPPTVSTPTQYYGTFADIATSAATGYLAPSGTVYSLASTPHQQQVYNFNLQIDRRFKSNILSVGYTGSLSRHLLWQRNINAVPLGAQFLNVNPQNKNPQNSSALPTNFLRPYSAYGDVFLYEFASNANYNGLLVSFQHRMSHGLNVAASYTLSKALDFSDNYSGAVDPFSSPRDRNYGPAGFDRRHVFTSNFYYSLPRAGKLTGIRPLGWVADNWELSGVVRIMSGAPLTPGYSLVTGIATPTGSASVSARLQVLDPNAPLAQRFGPPPEPAGQASLANAPWSVASTDPQLGNLGKNTVTGPGTNNWNLSLYRRVRFNERLSGQLRLETYNTFNHTQFSGVNSSLQFNTQGQNVNTAFMMPNSARPPRYVQIAFRFMF